MSWVSPLSNPALYYLPSIFPRFLRLHLPRVQQAALRVTGHPKVATTVPHDYMCGVLQVNKSVSLQSRDPKKYKALKI